MKFTLKIEPIGYRAVLTDVEAGKHLAVEAPTENQARGLAVQAARRRAHGNHQCPSYSCISGYTFALGPDPVPCHEPECVAYREKVDGAVVEIEET